MENTLISFWNNGIYFVTSYQSKLQSASVKSQIVFGFQTNIIRPYVERVHQLSFARCGRNISAEEFSDVRYPKPTLNLPFFRCKVERDEAGCPWGDRESHPFFIGPPFQIIDRIGDSSPKTKFYDLASSALRTASLI